MKKNLLVCLTLAAGTTAVMTGCENGLFQSEARDDSSRSYSMNDDRAMHKDMSGRCADDVYESRADSAAVNVGSSDLGDGSWSNRYAREPGYTRSTGYTASSGNGYYDSNGVWHSGGIDRSSDRWNQGSAQNGSNGYYDSNGVWHSNDSGLNNRSNGYYDSNGVWRSNTDSSYQSSSSRPNGYYDSNGVWRTGSGGAATATGTNITDQEARSSASRSNGYYDSNGVWRSNPDTGVGMNRDDRSPTAHATGNYDRSQTGSYDSNGKWQPNTPDSSTGTGTGFRSTPDRTNGYYDSNGVWHANTGTSASGNNSISTSGGSQNSGYYDSNGVWRSNTTSGSGANNQGNGYYDSNGVWRSNTTTTGGLPGGGSTSTPGSTGTPSSTNQSGYYDSNGVWRANNTAANTNPPGSGSGPDNAAPTAHAQGNYDRSDKSDTGMNGQPSGIGTTTGAVPPRNDTMRTDSGRMDTTRTDMRTDTTTMSNWSSTSATANWPSKNRDQVQMLVNKYGQPDEATASVAVWKNKGGFECIKVFKEEVDHQWPVAHTDFLEHAVAYKVPVDKVDDLAQFDTSVMTDITKGCLAAKCDSEAHNLLALNLADDICSGRKTADEAKAYFVRAINDEKAGKTDPYMQKLNFTPKSGTTAANPGRTDSGINNR